MKYNRSVFHKAIISIENNYKDTLIGQFAIENLKISKFFYAGSRSYGCWKICE